MRKGFSGDRVSPEGDESKGAASSFVSLSLSIKESVRPLI